MPLEVLYLEVLRSREGPTQCVKLLLSAMNILTVTICIAKRTACVPNLSVY